MNLPKKWSADWEVLRRQYECGPVTFSGESDSLFERHLLFDYTTDPARAEPRQQFEALAWSVRDVLSQRWVKSKRVHDEANGKLVYYLSMEFLIGRSLVNNVMNLRLGRLARETIEGKQVDWRRLVELEPDAGLGNGGLGRLAACFIDSLATLEYPATGYGLRYDYGIFRQEIRGGEQVEYPDYWLGRPDPWEVPRPAQTVRVRFNATIGMRGGEIVSTSGQPTDLLGIPHDRPVVGFGGRTINTLRLWRAGSPDYFDFSEFSHGDLFGAVFDTIAAESLTRVLYPDDSTVTGRSLRFLQEYFLVACSLADIVARFRRLGNDWPALPDKVAIQFNDTHPAIAVAELMRILLDDAKRPWDEAWDLTLRTLAYTNHTLLPEALETWPVELFERVLPRQSGSPICRNCAGCARWRTTPRSALASAAPSATRRCSSPNGSGPPPGRCSTPTRSSTARSSASTNTSGNCSTCCTSSCCTTDCGRSRRSTCRRAPTSSRARRRPPMRWPRPSSA
jgi:starch phosphorylase